MGTHSTCSLGRFSNGLLKDCAVMLCRRFARRSLQTKSIKCYKEHYSIILMENQICSCSSFGLRDTINNQTIKLKIILSLTLLLLLFTISTYLYRMTISVIETAINIGPVFTTERTATTPGTSRPTLFK